MKKKNTGPTYLPALKGRIGKWAFYTTLMTLDEVNERIYLSDEIYQNKNLSDMVQRSIKSGRAENIAAYLKNEKERFEEGTLAAGSSDTGRMNTTKSSEVAEKTNSVSGSS